MGPAAQRRLTRAAARSRRPSPPPPRPLEPSQPPEAGARVEARGPALNESEQCSCRPAQAGSGPRPRAAPKQRAVSLLASPRPSYARGRIKTTTTSLGQRLSQLRSSAGQCSRKRPTRNLNQLLVSLGSAMASLSPPSSHLSAADRLLRHFQHHAQPPQAGLRKLDSEISQQQAWTEHVRCHKKTVVVFPWQWDETDKSPECVLSDDKLGLCFHPQCSESTGACRGSRPLKRDGNYYYWEITVLDKTYGTSVMFGLCTKRQKLHWNEYTNLIGLDQEGWSLSHKGHIWHAGQHLQFAREFPTNQPVTVGLLFNTADGELSYFLNGLSLGVAFRGLNRVAPGEDLYPVVGSTAKCTRMRITASYRGFETLLNRSFNLMLSLTPNKEQLFEYLEKSQLPKHLITHLAEASQFHGKSTENAIGTSQFEYNNTTTNA